jgi:alkanesulfonate monooxygenase SsuD/methylene tetrahydromethanopterin reductase-like flavin-dependent oxidoreductase (luciferase family)
MEFWMGLHGMQSPTTCPRSFTWMYDEILHQATEAERMGFDGFALTEHHFWYDGYCPSLMPVLAGIARRTERIKILPLALLLPLRNPLRVAEEIALVDQLSHGRLALGFGYGYRTEEFEGFELDKKGRGNRFSEQIEVLNSALSSERFSHDGKYYSYDDVALSLKTVQEPHPPFWLAGGTQAATARRAGRSGVSYCVAGTGQGPEQIEALITEYKIAADEAGVPEDQQEVGVAVDTLVTESKDELDQIIAEDLVPVFCEQLAAFGFVREPDGTPIRDLPPDHPMFEFLFNSFVMGTPEDAVAKIKTLEEMGCSVFFPRIVEANFKSERILKIMQLFADKVLPHFGKGGA